MSDIGEELHEIRKAIDHCFTSNPGPLRMTQAKVWIANSYSEREFDENVVYGQIRGSCVNLPPTRKDREDAPKILHYDPSTRTYRRIDAGEYPNSAVISIESASFEENSDFDDESRSLFALESHLRDYLALHLEVLEPGLQLWCKEPPSIEYQVVRRRIDLLAKDKEGNPVVIELKLNRGYDRVLGQALLYRGLLKKELGNHRVRLMLIAAEITPELRCASEEIPDLALFEYALSMKVRQVGSSTENG